METNQTMDEPNEDLAPDTNTEVDIPAPSFAPENLEKEVAKLPDLVADAPKEDLSDLRQLPYTPEDALEQINATQYAEMVAEKIILSEESGPEGKRVHLKNGTSVFLPAR